MHRIDRSQWPADEDLRELSLKLGMTGLASALCVSRGTLIRYLSAIDGSSSTRATIAADDAFRARLHAAIRAGKESAASASGCAVKADKPWRPRRIHALATRSYTGSSAAWAAGG
jgi:hypothetical protein